MQVIDVFNQVIDKEARIVEGLVQLGHKKQSNISNPKILQTITDQEGQLLDELRMVEHERTRLLDVLAPGFTLGSWVEQADMPGLAKRIEELQETYAELASINVSNQSLLRESLAFIQFSINLLVEEPPPTYGKPATTNFRKTIFDRKV